MLRIEWTAVLIGSLCIVGCGDDSSSGGAGRSANGGSSGSANGGSTNGGSSGSANGGSSGSTNGGSTNGGSSGSANGGSANGGSTNGGSSSGGSAGVPSLEVCTLGCTTAADCVTNQFEVYDASHYTCDVDHCVYNGCRTDSECAALLPSYVCRDQGSGVAFCVASCTQAADCGSGMAWDDADNYVCEDGGCKSTGCNNQAECDALGAQINTPYRCAEFSSELSVCVPGCNSAADCPTADYACEDQACKFVGCTSDSACAAQLSDNRYVCR